MKKVLSMLFLVSFVLFVGCSKDEEKELTPKLVNTLWSSFSYKSTIDGTNVYKMIRFKSETELEYYSATEKTKIIGNVDILKYVYNYPTISITFDGQNMNGKTIDGMVTESFIKINEYTYTKE